MLGAELSSNFTTFKGGIVLQASDGGPDVVFPEDVMKLSITDPEQVKTLYSAANKNGDVLGPIVISRSFGRGEVFYCAPRLGAVNYQPNTNVGSKWSFEMNVPLKKTLMNVVRQAMGDDPLVLKPVRIPEKVFTTFYQQNYKGRQSRVVHLLNGTGVTVKKGDRVPTSKSRPAFPAITEDMVFEIELPALGQSYAVSPDYPGQKEIYTEKLSSTRYRVTVPREALQSYTILYFHED